MRISSIVILNAVFVLMNLQEANGWWVSRRRRRRRNPPPPRSRPSPRNCVVSSWTSWTPCSSGCDGTQEKNRRKTTSESNGGSCDYHLTDSRSCNTGCQNGGASGYYGCRCRSGWRGSCCQNDVNECASYSYSPCQHRCINTHGSYTCRCYACYTKVGTRCYLRECKIGSRCYAYGTKNPSNECQDCNRSNKLAWTNNNTLPCSDGNLCTRADHCVNGRCIGTPFTCLPCERCNGDTCTVKPGFCAIIVNGIKTCFNHNDLRPGIPCQQCNSNSPHKWTNNNNLPCSDNNVKTKDDRCVNGACTGTPYTCLPCESHDGRGCPLKNGHCVIQHNGARTCFANQQLKPGNPCQWCNQNTSSYTWSHVNGSKCDDGDPCTHSDKCAKGYCRGTSFKCNAKCQFCNGRECSQISGFGIAHGNCTCKISGKDYFHNQLNPENECQWCDLQDNVTRSLGEWTSRPGLPCDDGDPCTKNDMCTQGKCVGKKYSCSSVQKDCVKETVCLGDGRCKDIIRNSSTICRAANDSCDKPERCDGRLGSCPAAVTDPISIRTGTVDFQDSAYTSSASYHHITNILYFKVSNFNINCGQMTFKWYLLDGSSACHTSTSTKGQLSNTNTKQSITGLTLQDTKTYKLAIQAVDMRGGIRPLVCTSALTIDTSVPQNGWVRDGSTADIDYQSTKTITANWGGFTIRNGVQKYEWKVSYIAFGSSNTVNLLSLTSTGVNTRASKVFSNIADGSRVKVLVRAYTKAGLYSERTSDGVVVDLSKPIAGRVYDGSQTGVDATYAQWTNTFSINWAAFTDPHSGMLYYEWAVKRYGAGLITAYKKTALNRSSSASGLNLVSGERYCAVVKGYNKAKLFTESSSNCVLIDHDPPRAGSVNDGAVNDIQYQSNGTTISANWNGFSDGSKGSGIVGYQYKITNTRNNDVIGWTSVGMKTSISHSGLSLTNEVKYFVTVKAVDAVGLATEVKSNGVIVDTTRLVFTGEVKVRGVKDFINATACVYVPSTTTLKVTWNGFSGGSSGLDHYEWAVIPASRNVTARDFRRVSGSSLTTSASFSGLTMADGSAYRVVIRAYNRVLIYIDALSVLVIPDSSPPQAGVVSDGPNTGSDYDYQASLAYVKATWTTFNEPHTGIRQYYYAVGSCNQGNYHVTGNRFIKALPASSTSFSIQNPNLVNGQRYCTKVKAQNMAGIYSKEVSSDGFMVDGTVPVTREARVIDGVTQIDIDYQSNVTEMSASWEDVSDPESGIKYYEYGISRNRAGVPDVVQFKNNGLQTSARATGLSLRDDVYYFIVCAVNNAGLRNCLSSDGVLIDTTPPIKGIVNDGVLEPDLKYQSSLTNMAANWEGVWDLESQIERFEWAIKDNSSGNAALPFTDVGLATHVKNDNHLSLTNGRTYQVHLKIYNHAGGVREITSDGVTVDNTAPQSTTIYPGLPGDSKWIYHTSDKVFYTSSTAVISAYWKAFDEPESDIWYYKWAIGTSKCGTQIQPLINIGRSLNASVSTADLNVRYGIKYYITVTARNRAYLVSGSCSEAFLIDNSPPIVGSVKIGDPKKHQKYIGSKSIDIFWNDFTDRESGISFCEIYINSLNTSESLFINKTENSSGRTSVTHNIFSSGNVYKADVKCYNKAQLFSTQSSEPFIIDLSPPNPKGPVIIGISRNDSVQYQADNTSVTINWPSFEDKESPMKEYWITMGTKPLGEDVIPKTSVGKTNKAVRTNLHLIHGKIYHIAVYGVNSAGLNSTVQALPLLIDVTPPVASSGSVVDGNDNEDKYYFNPQEPISSHWENIHDSESGILRSHFCIGTRPFGCQIQGPTDLAKKTYFVCDDCKVNPGERVYMTVEVTNGAGLTVTKASNGMLLDSTPPIMSDVMDGNDVYFSDVDTALENWDVSAWWKGVEDMESGITKCMWHIVDEKNNKVISNNITSHFKLGMKQILTANRSYNSLPLKKNLVYYNMIVCSNGARLNAVARSDGFRVVSEWPIPAPVRDGHTKGKDVDYVTSTKDVGANWDAFKADQRDPVIEYLWAIGTTPGNEDVMKYKSAGLSLHDKVTLAADEPDLDILNTGQRYYITVKAVSASGMTSTRSSNGFTVDITPPVKSDVEVTFVVSDQSARNVDLRIDWSGVSDNESDIVDSEYCVGTTPGNCLTERYSAGRETIAVQASFTPISLAKYYAIVIVRNRAGLASVLTSRKISIDTSPPSRGQVIDGTGRDVDYMKVTNTMSCQWAGFEDRDSNVKSCKWKLIQQSVSSDGSYFGNDSMVLEQAVSSRGNETRQGLSLSPGSRYLNQITCANRDGFTVTSVSNGVIIDVTPPTSGTVVDGDDFSNDIDFMSGVTEVKTIWRGFKDDESGIMGYRWALGTSPGKDDVIGFRDVGKQRQGFAANVSLSPIGAYYVTVEAKNQAGLTSQGWSDGFVVDATPPEIWKVTRGSKTWIGPNGTISATWQSRDPESSVKNTEYCVGTSPNGCQVQPMKSLPGNSTQVTCTECKLSHSVEYYVTIKIWNQAGLYSIDTTEGVQVDLTPPLQGQVIPLDDVISCVQNCTLSTNVSGFIDPESGLSICQFAVRTSSSQYVVPFTNFSQLIYAQASSLTLIPGQRYYTVVRCVNNVGLSTNATSYGVLVDATPPAKGVVIVSPDRTHDVYGIHSSCHLYNSTMRIHWSGFYDTESSITGFRVAVGRHPNATNIQSFVDVGIATSFSLNIGPSEGLLSGDIVYILLEARNAAGLTTRAVSSPTRLVAADNEQYSREGDFYCLDV